MPQNMQDATPLTLWTLIRRVMRMPPFVSWGMSGPILDDFALMNEWKQKTGGIPQRRTCPLKTPAGHRLEVKGVTRNVCFHKGKKEEGEEGSPP